MHKGYYTITKPEVNYFSDIIQNIPLPYLNSEEKTSRHSTDRLQREILLVPKICFILFFLLSKSAYIPSSRQANAYTRGFGDTVCQVCTVSLHPLYSQTASATAADLEVPSQQ